MPFRILYAADDDAVEKIVNGEDALNAALELAYRAASIAREINPSATDAALIDHGGPIDDDGVVSAWFGSSSSIWHIIEFGSVNNPPYRPLTSAAEAIGLRFDPA